MTMDPQHRQLSHDSARASSNPVATAPAKVDTPRSLSSAQSTRSIKDLVNRYNQTSATANANAPVTQQERWQRHTPRTRLQKPSSPSKSSSSSGRSLRLNGTISPLKSPSRRNKPQPKKALFGETSDHTAQNPGYGIPYHHSQSQMQSQRRGSEGSMSSADARTLTRHHKRTRSNIEHDLPTPHNSTHPRPAFAHRRTRSDYVAPDPQHSDMGPLKAFDFSFSPPRNHVHMSTSTPERIPSRIPVSNSRRSNGIEPISPTTTRNISQMGQSTNHFPSSSPLHTRRPHSGLPTPVSRRYGPIANQRHAPTGQSVQAIIRAPPPQDSPPLRSSRPRQPISVASTTASRAKSGQLFESAISNDSPDSAKYRYKKKIPELARVDFAARREKIQRAISESLREEDDQGSVSTRSSLSGVVSRRVSNANRPDTSNGHNHDRDVDSSFGSTDIEHTHVELALREDGPLSPTTPRNIPGAYVDFEDSPLSVKQSKKSSEPETEAETETETEGYLYSETTNESSPQVNGYHQFSSQDQSPQLDSCDESLTEEQAIEEAEPATLFSHVMRMRERSTSSASRTDFEESSSFAPSSDNDDQASIQIMLQDHDGSADHTPASVSEEWSVDQIPSSPPGPEMPLAPTLSPPQHVPDSDEDSFASDAAQVGLSSPWMGDHGNHDSHLDDLEPETPRKPNMNLLHDDDKTPRQSKRVGRTSILSLRADWNKDNEAYGVVNRIASEFKETGEMSPEMLHEFQQHVGSLSPNLSKAEASDADSVSFLLESMLREQGATSEAPKRKSDHLSPTSYNPTDRSNMETPEDEVRGTAIIYNTTYRRSAASLPRASQDALDENSYLQAFSPSSIIVNTPASQWDAATPASQYTQPSGVNTPGMQSDTEGGADDDDDYRPPPPPKDYGYSPRSSTGQYSTMSLNQVLPSSRDSRSSDRLQLPEIPTGTGLGLTMSGSLNEPSKSQPPLPHHAPPPPPPPSKSAPQLEVVLTDASPGPTYLSQPTSPVTARQTTSEERFRNFSTPARPSMEQMKPEMVPLPPSQSMSSFQSSVRPSIDIGAPATMPPSPNPEHRRLVKRKNVIKELVDTEYSYHQDMKIIEDIYKATVGDIMTVDDKKALFGNSDQVEMFSLEFYDALRRAVSPIYVPPKSSRWQSKRGSEVSDGTQPSDTPDDEKDRLTRVGEVFQHFLSRMEKVYSAYLKNHDCANQRLQKLMSDPTVKCWLTECHNNASDITAAWDLDSLLVKPVQRILKYPLLLQQLMESTPESHPDYKALHTAYKETMNASKRINEAKRRADLVEQIVNRKQRGQSDVRNAIARSFGRRTDKLKERVGIAEIYQDAEFDELAHKFGGHFIKLQVCMRDVQGSLNELDKAVDHFLNFATSLEAVIEIGQSTTPEIESKWRKFILAIRELATVALPDHKKRIQQHVIEPMITCIKLHDGPQDAIQKRKKRIVDFAKCKSLQQKGEKPEKKILEASEMYEALNEQLKLDLPRLYSLTGDLIKACLDSNVYLQGQWMWLWKEKLAPVIDFRHAKPHEIVPAFIGDFDIIHSQVLTLGIANGSTLADAANFLTPQTTLMADDVPSSYASLRRPSNLTSGTRTLSVGSENQPSLGTLTPTEGGKSYGSALPSPSLPDTGQPGYYGRMRSSSSLSTRGRSPSVTNPNNGLPPARMPTLAPKSSFSASRPSTAQRPANLKHMSSRLSLDTENKRSPSVRPSSAVNGQQPEPRFSGMFSSAMPMSDSPGSPGPLSPKHAPFDTPVMFVAASLFEFNIDRARREAGYPYLTYVEGEVFDVIAQKGELWLAKNQDDPTNSLGWIWEQHFVILSQES